MNNMELLTLQTSKAAEGILENGDSNPNKTGTAFKEHNANLWRQNTHAEKLECKGEKDSYAPRNVVTYKVP